MKTGSMAIGSPEGALCAAYCARLAKFYGLPSRGGTNNDAKSVSVQSGYESMLIMSTALLEEINYIIHSAGILDGYGAMSFEQFIVDLDIIGSIKRFVRGVEINEDTLAFNIVKEVGIGGEFLTARHTLNYCRTESWVPDIGLRGVIADSDPNNKLVHNINKKMERMLSGYKQPELSMRQKRKLEEYLVDQNYDISIFEE